MQNVIAVVEHRKGQTRKVTYELATEARALADRPVFKGKPLPDTWRIRQLSDSLRLTVLVLRSSLARWQCLKSWFLRGSRNYRRTHNLYLTCSVRHLSGQ